MPTFMCAYTHHSIMTKTGESLVMVKYLDVGLPHQFLPLLIPRGLSAEDQFHVTKPKASVLMMVLFTRLFSLEEQL